MRQCCVILITRQIARHNSCLVTSIREDYIIHYRAYTTKWCCIKQQILASTRICLINRHIIRTIFCTIFDTHLNYANIILCQNLNVGSRIVILQKKALRIMNFWSRDSHSRPLFKDNQILTLKDKILTQNILFINKSLNKMLPPIFKNWFILCSGVHNYQTVSSTSDKIFQPSYRTDSFRKNLITMGAINSYNKTQYQSVICHWKHIAQAKLKVYTLKNTLKTINEDIERSKVEYKDLN